MKTLTKKHIFECKLKDMPIYVYANRISPVEIQCLIDNGIVEQFATRPRKAESLAFVIALYPIVNVMPQVDITGLITELHRLVGPKNKSLECIVKLKCKSLIRKEL